MSEFVIKPHISRWIGGMYIGVTILLSSVFFGLCGYFYFNPPELTVKIAVLAPLVLVSMFVVWITASFYETKYTIELGVLHARSPFMRMEVRLKDVVKAERVMVPAHFRAGASLYCGWFYVPNVGWVRSIITNLRDAVMITAKDGKRYLITPSEPERFIRKLMG
jgi:hypothetical protein